MITLTVNGRSIPCSVDPRTPFLYVLREHLGLRGTKYGCGEGECGACTIIVDGKTVCSCLATTGSLDGAEVTTVEGLNNDPVGVRLFNSFVQAGAVQCGFCTPGIILSAWHHLAYSESVTRESIRDALGGNLCRCTGYVKVLDAIAQAAIDAGTTPIVNRKGHKRELVESSRYARPTSMRSLLALLDDASANWRMISGGTDLMVQHEHRWHDLSLLDLAGVTDLAGIEDRGDCIRIGATTTWSEIRQSPMIRKYLPLLAISAEQVGAIQIQNRGTIGGNIMNASPAADGLPALYAYDARVGVISRSSTDVMPLCEFVLSPRKTKLRRDQILADVLIPKPVGEEGVFFFEKVGPRNAQTITKASLAFHAQVSGRSFRDVRISVGAVGPTIKRVPRAEQLLESGTFKLIQDVALIVSEEVTPIDDIRSTAAYRKMIVGNLFVRGFARAKASSFAPLLKDIEVSFQDRLFA